MRRVVPCLGLPGKMSAWRSSDRCSGTRSRSGARSRSGTGDWSTDSFRSISSSVVVSSTTASTITSGRGICGRSRGGGGRTFNGGGRDEGVSKIIGTVVK
ncbi:unnamed protein product [Pylaiella littoralis]